MTALKTCVSPSPPASQSQSSDNAGSTHTLTKGHILPCIYQAQRLKEQSGCVFYVARGAGLQFILPSGDSSFAQSQLAQLGTRVIRFLRLSDSTVKAEYFLDGKYIDF